MKASEPARSAPEPTHRRSALDASGRERPRFLLDYPDDPALERLIAAFESGDYALVRKLAPEIESKSTDPAVKTAAREIRRRIDPDPLIRYLLFISIGLLLFVVLTVYAHRVH